MKKHIFISPRGNSWEEDREKLLTPEERAASELRISMMVELTKARTEKGISQKKLEELCGVKQPVIARMERGYTSPQLDTVLKVLAPLGKTLCIMDIAETRKPTKKAAQKG
jgi:ribosome-binding protein aMBF1 (putative translation factor)